MIDPKKLADEIEKAVTINPHLDEDDYPCVSAPMEEWEFIINTLRYANAHN